MRKLISIIKKEFKRFFTDKRLVASLFLPGIMIYVLYTLMGNIMPSIAGGVDENYIYRFAGSNTPTTIKLLLNELPKTSYQEYNDTFNANDLKEKVKDNTYDCAFIFEKDFDSKVEDVKNGLSDNLPKIELFYMSDNIASSTAYSMVLNLFNNIPTYNIELFKTNLDEADLSSNSSIGSKILTSLMPMILISLLFSSCISLCPESIAGEKERGTMATLLVTPTKRYLIALGKILSLATLSLIGGITSFIGLIFSLPSLMELNPSTVGLNISISSYFLLFFIIISCILLLVCLMCLISTFAKNVKEANSYIGIMMPFLMIFSIVPSFAPINNIGLSFVPIYNVSISLTNIIGGTIDLLFITFTIVSNVIYSIITTLLIVKLFNNEKVMFNK